MRFLILALLLVSPLCFGKTVVVIESYHDEYKWDADYLRAIESVLGAKYDIRVLALDTKRLPKSEWPQKVASIQQTVAEIKPDVAILGDDNAFTLMAQHLADNEIPVVFFGVNGGPDQHPALTHPLVTGILERPFFAENVRHMRKVLKQNERFLVLMDDSPTMRNAVEEYFGDVRQTRLHGSHLDIVLTNDKDAWLNAVFTAHERYDAIIVGTHHTIRDRNDKYIQPRDLMDQAFIRSQVPIFSFWDIFIGENQGIGGFTVSAYQEGVTGARLASLILNGLKPHQIPQIKSISGHYVYSRSGMQHWNVALSPLIASQSSFVD
ncbi:MULTISPECIES: ABC transporter substrate-binding protein [unclassified Marinobacter]|uniref:ABC transporter substrate-binding protein n=1 Tax=unclassified Marinobacter TaxID=83889 RepID=UPI0026E13A11|nr:MULTISPECIES: ABC transporter substrate binding protein [unclassified Marinobacter]MDO6442271.1 ABC transporter substrate binding protein [Marinobacter sp. 2_MG-2023]MDO6824959.1 ABC transporter substrate binding protein [Marinobacter sp. 1_MG-2023]